MYLLLLLFLICLMREITFNWWDEMRYVWWVCNITRKRNERGIILQHKISLETPSSPFYPLNATKDNPRNQCIIDLHMHIAHAQYVVGQSHRRRDIVLCKMHSLTGRHKYSDSDYEMQPWNRVMIFYFRTFKGDEHSIRKYFNEMRRGAGDEEMREKELLHSY